MNAKLYTYSILRRNSTIYCHPSLDYYTTYFMPQLQSITSCAICFFHMIIFPTYISSVHALDRSPAHRPYLVLQLECISNGIKGFLPSGRHFAASAARFICTKGFHPCQIPPRPTRKQCIDEQLTPFSTSQCKLTVRFQQQRLHGILHLTYTVSAHSVICILV